MDQVAVTDEDTFYASPGTGSQSIALLCFLSPMSALRVILPTLTEILKMPKHVPAPS